MSAVTPTALELRLLLVSIKASATTATAPTLAMPIFPAARITSRDSGDSASMRADDSSSLVPIVYRPERVVSTVDWATRLLLCRAYSEARFVEPEKARTTTASRSMLLFSSVLLLFVAAAGIVSSPAPPFAEDDESSIQPFIFFPALLIWPSMALLDFWIPNSTIFAPVAMRTAVLSPVSVTDRIRSRSASMFLRHFDRSSYTSATATNDELSTTP
mmetsp:Transcript_21411/g.47438  ORF Transcript_21411/g.47438 Transcript_21411/m.47438 type:complete len:216 (-) Transcript_21411:511-1158(-)